MVFGDACTCPLTQEEEQMETQKNRVALDRHWTASASGDLEAEHQIYDDNLLCEFPQSGEKIRGRGNLQALRGHHPGKPSGSALTICGSPSTSAIMRPRSYRRSALWSFGKAESSTKLSTL